MGETEGEIGSCSDWGGGMLSKFLIQFSVEVEKERATHSSTLAWKIPWKEEPGGL